MAARLYIPAMTQYITVSADDRVEARNGVIKLHGPEGFEGMRRAGKLAAEILDALAVEPSRELRDILVLCPARQDFVADHRQRRGPGFRLLDDSPPVTSPVEMPI